MYRLLAVIIFAVWSIKASATVISKQSLYLPQEFSVKALGKAVNGQSELVVKGFNHNSKPRIVILRFDDHRSSDYHSRLNIERVVIPGSFVIQLSLSGLKTENKRLFDWRQWQRFIVFADSGPKNISINRVAITGAATFSQASMGFDLGSSDSPVHRGMQQITPEFAGLKGQYLQARHFASGNALNSDGIEGIKNLTLNVPNGQWDVTLWFAMQGEWENLPRQQHQHVQLQGNTVFKRDLSALQWLAQDYLAGQYREAWIGGSPWQLFGERAQQRVTATVEVNDGMLQLSFAGQTTHDNFLSAIFISPTSAQGRDTLKLFKALEQRFEQKWQVGNKPMSNTAIDQITVSQVYFDRHWQPDLPTIKRLTPVVTTTNGYAVLDFEVKSAHMADNVQLKLDLSDPSIKAEIRQGFWRYQRPQASSTLLSLSADELQTVYPGKLLRLPAQLSRRINLLIPVKGESIKGLLTLSKNNKLLASSEFDVKVLDTKLPKMSQSVGIYHEKAPHLSWFEELKHKADQTLDCDYRYLKKLGLTALSPPLSTPAVINEAMSNQQVIDTIKPYVDDLSRYHDVFATTAIDYTTLKRLHAYYPHKPLLKQRHLSALVQTLVAYKLPIPQFAVVDEMARLNAAQLARFSTTMAQLQNAMPGASFVGQLNKPANQQLVAMLDTLLLNHGFAVDKPIINTLQKQGKSVRFYNVDKMRLAAGFYLWQSKAEGYLQWHGRMPTGMPFNPVDGREADFQLIYPSLHGCVGAPDINSALLAIAEGIKDRRWMSWLIEQAHTDIEALKLLAKLKGQIPTSWAKVQTRTSRQVHAWREAITNLAEKRQIHRGEDYAKN